MERMEVKMVEELEAVVRELEWKEYVLAGSPDPRLGADLDDVRHRLKYARAALVKAQEQS